MQNQEEEEEEGGGMEEATALTFHHNLTLGSATCVLADACADGNKTNDRTDDACDNITLVLTREEGFRNGRGEKQCRYK